MLLSVIVLLRDLSSSSPAALPWLWSCLGCAVSQLAATLLDGAEYMPAVMDPLGFLGITEGLGIAARLTLVLLCQLVVLQAATALGVPLHLTKLRRPRSVKGGAKTYHWGGAKLYHLGGA